MSFNLKCFSLFFPVGCKQPFSNTKVNSSPCWAFVLGNRDRRKRTSLEITLESSEQKLHPVIVNVPYRITFAATLLYFYLFITNILVINRYLYCFSIESKTQSFSAFFPRYLVFTIKKKSSQQYKHNVRYSRVISPNYCSSCIILVRSYKSSLVFTTIGLATLSAH